MAIRQLARKFQPQWHFKTKAQARKELSFQKKVNPVTFKWLLKKDIKVGGKRIATKEALKRKPRTRGRIF